MDAAHHCEKNVSQECKIYGHRIRSNEQLALPLGLYTVIPSSVLCLLPFFWGTKMKCEELYDVIV